jgi:succinate dehydrogenase / fumarate reductase cytochrome b subunit
MKMGTLDLVDIDGEQVKDLYGPVYVAFKNILFVIFYVVCMAFIGLHLSHGFQSAFQSLGLNHKKYTPLIKGLGIAYSILIPLGFAIIPLYFYFFIK